MPRGCTRSRVRPLEEEQQTECSTPKCSSRWRNLESTHTHARPDSRTRSAKPTEPHSRFSHACARQSAKVTLRATRANARTVGMLNERASTQLAGRVGTLPRYFFFLRRSMPLFGWAWTRCLPRVVRGRFTSRAAVVIKDALACCSAGGAAARARPLARAPRRSRRPARGARTLAPTARRRLDSRGRTGACTSDRIVKSPPQHAVGVYPHRRAPHVLLRQLPARATVGELVDAVAPSDHCWGRSHVGFERLCENK